MRFIYVAGPYTNGDVGENVRNAILAGDRLLDKGYLPYIPHLTHFWHLLSPKDYCVWTSMDLAWLDKCDAILRLPGESKGADFEVNCAMLSGMPVYYSLEEIP